MAGQELELLREAWAGQWPDALVEWSRFTRLRDPRWCLSSGAAQKEGLTDSFAMIRLTDQAIVIDLEQIRGRHLERFAREILAHEIGHHVYCPANLGDQGRLIARIRAGLPTKEQLAPLVANLYADLLVNDRLQRAGLNVAGVYQALGGGASDRMWTFLMRLYEILWGLQSGTLARGPRDGPLEGDAQLGARLVRSYAREWLDGAGRFAVLLLPYLLDDEQKAVLRAMRGWFDTRKAGQGAGGEAPAGLAEIEAGERGGAIHPSQDPELTGLDESAETPEGDRQGPPVEATSPGGSSGQYREPFEYGEILRSLGLNLDDHQAAVRYYRERALPHLIRYPVREIPQASEPLAEGLETWDFGQPLEDADWMESILASPRVVPGITTVQRVWGTTEGTLPEKRPVDLDLYVDCSGSMPNPQQTVSYLTLAGAIVALSALRVGARVQATLWSGARQFETTGGFTTDWQQILSILTGYLGGGTAFPIHMLRDTYAARRPQDRDVHILVLSDDGVTTLFDKDERGNSGWDVSRAALAAARGGGTLALNLYRRWMDYPDLVRAQAEGWEIYRVRDWNELVEFARAFARQRYEGVAK